MAQAKAVVQAFQQVSSTKPWKLLRSSAFVGHTICLTVVAKPKQEKAAPRASVCRAGVFQTPLASRPSLKQSQFHQRLVPGRTADQPSFCIRNFRWDSQAKACLRSLGLVDSVGIDGAMPTRLNGPIVKLDLLQPPHLKLVKDLITNRACVYVHFAPPCGTASRAPLIQAGDQYMPPPLRNDDYPNGLPWLTKDQQERVNKANELYRITCELIILCQTHQLPWSCENPGRSFMWHTASFQRLFSTIECQSTQMHHCMYVSSRRKLTRLIHNIQSFHQLNQMCDNQHEHEPWGQKPDGSWATSEENAYPWPLARAIAAQVVIQLLDKGPSHVKNLPPLVPEFKQVIHQDSQAPLPAHARLLSTGVCRECQRKQ